MHYLITGGSGFLGIHLIKRLLHLNAETNNQKLKTKNKITILDLVELPEKNLLTKLTFIQGDVRNPSDVKRAMIGVDVVIHAAAALPLESAHNITTTTVDGTRNVLEAALNSSPTSNPPSLLKRGSGGVLLKKSKNKNPNPYPLTPSPLVIYVSSTAVYGVPEKHPIFETDPLVGVGPYGHAKIAAEKLCEQYRTKGLIVPIVRPKTFIGTERLGVFQILCNWVREGHRIPIIGSGHNRYQLLEVTDLVEAIMLLSNSKLETRLSFGALAKEGNSKLSVNDTFNVGAEHFSTVREDVGSLCQFAKSGSTIMPIPSWMVKPALRTLEALNLSPLYRWVYDTADKDSFVSINKLKALGWQPKFSNSEALIHMYKWYLKHYQEVESQSGTTHRVSWNQGALSFFKRFL